MMANVTCVASKDILLDEFARGYDLTQGLCREDMGGPRSWKSVYEPLKFFGAEWNHFILVELLTSSKESFLTFSERVETGFPILIERLEQEPNLGLRPHSMRFDIFAGSPELEVEETSTGGGKKSWANGCAWFIAFYLTEECLDPKNAPRWTYDHEGQRRHSVDLREAVKPFVEKTNRFPRPKGMQYAVKLRVVTKNTLPSYIPRPSPRTP